MSTMGALPPKEFVRAGLVVAVELALSAAVITSGLVGIGIAMIAAAVLGTAGQLLILARAVRRAADQPGDPG
jgi:hypothetical protein